MGVWNVKLMLGQASWAWPEFGNSWSFYVVHFKHWDGTLLCLFKFSVCVHFISNPFIENLYESLCIAALPINAHLMINYCRGIPLDDDTEKREDVEKDKAAEE